MDNRVKPDRFQIGDEVMISGYPFLKDRYKMGVITRFAKEAWSYGGLRSVYVKAVHNGKEYECPQENLELADEFLAWVREVRALDKSEKV